MWGPARLLRPRGVRHMGATGGGGYGTGEYRGLKVPPVAAWHQHVATFFGCTMWLWIFWRFKNDGKALMVRAARAAAPRANIPPPHVFLARVGAPPQGLPFLNRGLQACQSPPDHKLRQRAFSWPAVSIPDGRHSRARGACAHARPPAAPRRASSTRGSTATATATTTATTENTGTVTATITGTVATTEPSYMYV